MEPLPPGTRRALVFGHRPSAPASDKNWRWGVITAAALLFVALLVFSPLTPRHNDSQLVSSGASNRLKAGFSDRRGRAGRRKRRPITRRVRHEAEEEEDGEDADDINDTRRPLEDAPAEGGDGFSFEEEQARGEAIAEGEAEEGLDGVEEVEGGLEEDGEGGIIYDGETPQEEGGPAADKGSEMRPSPDPTALTAPSQSASATSAPSTAPSPSSAPASPAGKGQHSSNSGIAVGAAGIPEVLRPFVWTPPPVETQASSSSCRPFSGMVVVMTHTHLQARPAEERSFCGGLWKTQAHLGFRPIVIGDTVHLTDAVGQPPAPYVHLLKVSTHHGFLSDVLAAGVLPNDTLVVYHDALDVLALGGPSEVFACVSAAYCARRMNVPSDVYFLGERSLWPPSCRYVDEARSWCNDHPELLPLPVYPDLTEPGGSPEYRFINSGMYAGSVPALHAFLGASRDQSDVTGSGDDQELFNDLATNWADTWRARFQLDTLQTCFGSAHRSRESYTRDGKTGRWANGLTGHSPLLMHFNGGGKEWMPDALASAPGASESWGGSPSLAGAQLLLWGRSPDTSRAMRTAELCAGAPGAR